MLRFARRQTREDVGQAEATRLVQAYADLIARLARSYLRSTADAEDIVQDVLIKLLVRERTLDSAEHERAWVIAATRNACLDLLKSARYRTTVALDDACEPAVFDAPDDTIGVLEVVDQLPRAYREAVHLHYYEGLTIKEIAELTGESVGAVAKRLSRARATLKDRIGN